jgi:hypothetical protein
VPPFSTSRPLIRAVVLALTLISKSPRPKCRMSKATAQAHGIRSQIRLRILVEMFDVIPSHDDPGVLPLFVP